MPKTSGHFQVRETRTEDPQLFAGGRAKGLEAREFKPKPECVEPVNQLI